MMRRKPRPWPDRRAQRLLAVFLAEVGATRYGYDLHRLTGLSAARMYPRLARLVHEGYVIRGLPEPGEPGKPRRVPYYLNPERGDDVVALLDKVADR